MLVSCSGKFFYICSGFNDWVYITLKNKQTNKHSSQLNHGVASQHRDTEGGGKGNLQSDCPNR